MDPPNHRIYRKVASGFFTPRGIGERTIASLRALSADRAGNVALQPPDKARVRIGVDEHLELGRGAIDDEPRERLQRHGAQVGGAAAGAVSGAAAAGSRGAISQKMRPAQLAILIRSALMGASILGINVYPPDAEARR